MSGGISPAKMYMLLTGVDLKTPVLILKASLVTESINFRASLLAEQYIMLPYTIIGFVVQSRN